MAENQNLEIYAKVAAVPKEAQKAIAAGRLKGMTDINPMWRIKALTEVFGPVGIGWKYVITDKRLQEGADGTVCAFVDIDLYYRFEGEWSEAIPGTGGSAFIANERNGKYTSDECFKMALTDALSVACKALGVGADVYWQGGRTKYSTEADALRTEAQAAETPRARLVRLIKSHGLNVTEYSAEHRLTKDSTDEDILKCVRELEAS